MNSVVIEHVALDELPVAWRAQLLVSPNARLTIRIEEEAEQQEVSTKVADNPLFGMWQDRVEMADTTEYVRNLRAPRYGSAGSRRED
jgi:hypothetical protein